MVQILSPRFFEHKSDWLMTRGKTLEFQVKDTDFVSLGNASTNIRLTHGIAPQEFIEIYQSISCSYNLQITEEFIKRFWLESTFFGVKRKSELASLIDYLVDFVLEAHCMSEENIHIEPLVKEFKQSGDIYELRHVCSLAFLSSVYVSQGYTVEFRDKSEGKNPDFFVNEIAADLKVIKQSDLEAIHRKRGRVYRSKISEDICYDIGTSIRNRLHEGIKQAELVFIDMSVKSLLSIWDEEEFDTDGNVVPEPQRFRVVYFCKRGSNVSIGRKKRYSFFGTYIDIDPHLWDFIKQSNRMSIHTMLGGPADII